MLCTGDWSSVMMRVVMHALYGWVVVSVVMKIIIITIIITTIIIIIIITIILITTIIITITNNNNNNNNNNSNNNKNNNNNNNNNMTVSYSSIPQAMLDSPRLIPRQTNNNRLLIHITNDTCTTHTQYIKDKTFKSTKAR